MTVRTLAAAAVLLATPALGLAASAPEGGKQADPLTPNLVNSVVTLVVFLGLLAILYRFAWGPIMKGLAAREQAQYQALDEARAAREEAAAMRAQLQAEMAKATDQVRALLDEARRDADALKASEREAGARDAAAERERAQREIAAARDAALKDIYDQAVRLAALMSEKALRRSVSAEDHRRLLDESIAELKDAASKA
jgi:F-type H+-transporting ATPase subunit b